MGTVGEKLVSPTVSYITAVAGRTLTTPLFSNRGCHHWIVQPLAVLLGGGETAKGKFLLTVIQTWWGRLFDFPFLMVGWNLSFGSQNFYRFSANIVSAKVSTLQGFFLTGKKGFVRVLLVPQPVTALTVGETPPGSPDIWFLFSQ